MSKFNYNESEPTNPKTQYSEHDILDFMIQDTADMDLVANSVTISASLQVQEPSGTRCLNKKVYFNNNAGAHVFCESVTVSSNLGQHEHISQYPRMVAMFEVASKGDNDTFNSSDACEMISTSIEQSQAYCSGNVTAGGGSSTHIADDCDWVIKPRCILNKMSANLPFSKVGYVKLSITLSNIIDALFTSEATPTLNYILTDVKCHYKTAPTQNQSVMMRSVVPIRTSINSSNANISAKVPAICDSVSCIFMKQADDSSVTTNQQKLDKLLKLDSVNFLFNDNLNKHITFELTDRGTIIQNFIESMGDTGHNRVNSNYWKSNHMGVGLNWGQMVDLTNQKFNVSLKTDAGVSNANPYFVDMFFHSIVAIK